MRSRIGRASSSVGHRAALGQNRSKAVVIIPEDAGCRPKVTTRLHGCLTAGSQRSGSGYIFRRAFNTSIRSFVNFSNKASLAMRGLSTNDLSVFSVPTLATWLSTKVTFIAGK